MPVVGPCSPSAAGKKEVDSNGCISQGTKVSQRYHKARSQPTRTHSLTHVVHGRNSIGHSLPESEISRDSAAAAAE
jgi:hypothetical protein